ncbi:MAG: hypothetical protein KDA41_13380, partial [Planctomycetales bacterium]|nr:hypothetical protein [Planctomycetales bacterium]
YQLGTLIRLARGGTRTVRRAAVLALGMLGDYSMNRVLGLALQDRDRGVRLLADQALRQIWPREGNPSQRSKLHSAIRLNQLFRFADACRWTTELIAEAPDLAEAYHQRAIAFACQGEFEAAVEDCHMALEFNPYHFAAAAAMGQAQLELDDRAAALESFQRALRLNPDLDGVRARVQQLQRQQ